MPYLVTTNLKMSCKNCNTSEDVVSGTELCLACLQEKVKSQQENCNEDKEEDEKHLGGS